jgi:glucosyl-dolichyl phosphate glucuronosyltransferase
MKNYPDNTWGLSIVICTFNRIDSLTKTLLSLEQSTIPSMVQLELIIVANGCNQEVIEKIKKHLCRYPIDSRLIEEPLANLSNARNLGIKYSYLDLIAFLDDDVLVDPAWAMEVMSAFSDQSVDILGGKVELHFDGVNIPEWLDVYHRRLLSENVRGESLRPAGVSDVFGCNFVCRRSVFRSLGGFNTSLGRAGDEKLAGEEAELIFKALRCDFRVWYSPMAKVKHLVTAERLRLDYLRACAKGAGIAYAANTLNDYYQPETLISKLKDLLLLAREEAYSKETNHKKNMYLAVRRNQLFGELITLLEMLVGNVDVHSAIKNLKPSIEQCNSNKIDQLTKEAHSIWNFPTNKDLNVLKELSKASSLVYFHGESQEISHTFGDLIKPPYTLEFNFLSDLIEGREYHIFNSHSPPMPLLLAPVIALYQVDRGTYSINIGRNGKHRFEFATGPQWVKMVATADENNILTLYLNGRLAQQWQCDSDDVLIKKICIGNGYFNRRWNGWVSSLHLSRVLLMKANDESAEGLRKDEHTIAHYSGREFEARL